MRRVVARAVLGVAALSLAAAAAVVALNVGQQPAAWSAPTEGDGPKDQEVQCSNWDDWTLEASGVSAHVWTKTSCGDGNIHIGGIVYDVADDDHKAILQIAGQPDGTIYQRTANGSGRSTTFSLSFPAGSQVKPNRVRVTAWTSNFWDNGPSDSVVVP